MDPFSPFALLPSDIDHEHFMLFKMESSLSDTNRARTALYNILFGWVI